MMEHQGEGSDVMSRDKTSQSLQHRMINEQNFCRLCAVWSFTLQICQTFVPQFQDSWVIGDQRV